MKSAIIGQFHTSPSLGYSALSIFFKVDCYLQCFTELYGIE